jgi:TIR domain-containing protein
MKDFFISYRKLDHSTAFEIKDCREPTYKTILYERPGDMDLRQDAVVNLHDALRRSHVLLACISSEYTLRRLCQMEYSAAVASRIWIVFIERISKSRLETKPWALALDYWSLRGPEEKCREIRRAARFLRS